MKKSGTTWWGRRWIDALEHMSSDYSSRLARGRTYARAGRVHDLEVRAGAVAAKVTGSRRRPYEVRLELESFPPEVWGLAIGAMAEKAHFAAELLAGRMPQEIDAAFEQARTSLFPVEPSDLETDCSCPDWANPCKHVAATHYVLGEAFDNDPFLLFELRGKTKGEVLEALRAMRAGDTGAAPVLGHDEAVPSVKLGRLESGTYDKARQPMTALHLRFETPPVDGTLLRLLGAPPGWSDPNPPLEMLTPLIRRAAEQARRLALAEPDVASQAPTPEPAPSRRGPRPRTST